LLTAILIEITCIYSCKTNISYELYNIFVSASSAAAMKIVSKNGLFLQSVASNITSQNFIALSTVVAPIFAPIVFTHDVRDYGLCLRICIHHYFLSLEYALYHIAIPCGVPKTGYMYEVMANSLEMELIENR
jgi:hypothetical protein